MGQKRVTLVETLISGGAMRFTGSTILACCLLAPGATPLQAQSGAILSIETRQFAAAAELRPLPLVARPVESRVLGAGLVRTTRSGRSLGQVLMIVGGAGIVTGLIVDEPIITIAGAGVGGYGLYLYLR
jgi:hypothetical protein